MYNLIVNFREIADGARMLEYADDAVKKYVAPGNTIDPARLMTLPTIVMPEVGTHLPQVARIGHLDYVNRTAKGDYRFRFLPTPGVPELPLSLVQAHADALAIMDWEFTRTHWAVKDVDLHHILHTSLTPPPTATVFKLPREVPQENLVAVMMPFESTYTPVYKALKDAATAAGFDCQRVDDIWIAATIMDDVASLIWRASVVICDLSGKNPNVFYETGIAHTLGREVLPITQFEGDVPFDLRALRHVKYLNNGEGLQALKAQITSRLTHLADRV